MYNIKIIPIVKGLVKHVPGVKSLMQKRTGGSIDSRYCYSVWMRHLIKWSSVYSEIPETVAELGPGDSLGTAFAALLSGSKQVVALDIFKYWDNKKNLRIFEELVIMFKNKLPIPNDLEFSRVKPILNDYSFPSKIISDNILTKSLSEKRLDRIRKEIMDIDNPNNIFIKYKIPWYDSNVIKESYVDFMYSQAVLEYVEDLDNTYYAMKKWIKPSGLMSNTIDFKSDGITKYWNGHWTFSKFQWKIVKGGKLVVINRAPLSKHLKLNNKYDFEVVQIEVSSMKNELNNKLFSKEFKHLSKKDRTTSGAYILSR